MGKLNVLTYNVHGLNHPIKRKKIFSQLKKLQCSIALLQETHLSELEHKKLKREWVNQVYSASFGKKRGVAILINKSLTFSTEKVIQDKLGRYVMIRGQIEGEEVFIVNVYAPNEYDENYFKDIANIIAENAKGIIILGGDFNAVQDGKLDRTPAEVGAQSKKTKTLNNMITELGLGDPWRHINPSMKDFTFFSNVHNSYSRIDFFCISQQHMYKVNDCSIETITLSDHAPVILHLDLGKENVFKYWRMNVSLLTNTAVVQELKQTLIDYLDVNDTGEINPSTLWSAAKAVIRGKMIQISSRLKKQRLAEQNNLEHKIKILEMEHKKSGSNNILLKLKETRKDLDKILTYQAEGALRFSRQKYYETGNKASRLLGFQLRKAQADRMVHKIIDPTSKINLYRPKEIANAFASYYKKLYEEPNSINDDEIKHKCDTFLKNLNLPTLSKEEALSMISDVTENEIREAIRKLKNNKSPGTDGLPGEFYKCFLEVLLPLLTKVFNYTLKTGDMPGSWSEAIISVIHKEGKDAAHCDGYRPISLLCNDLKLLTNILAKRIKIHVQKLIHPDQTGFVPNRHSANNIRRTLNIITQAKNNDRNSMLIGFDAQKAFDTVNWQFLYNTLSMMGFHPQFVEWIKVIYTNPKSCVRVNGSCSDFFYLERGVRQGDCLSPLLFAINIEPLAASIRMNENIKGIEDGSKKEHKISLFADDILTYVSDPATSVIPLIKTLEEYGRLSGYRINQAKSEAMMLKGQWPTNLKNKFHFHMSNQGFRYLGIIITPEVSQLFKANYGKLLNEIKKDLTRWDFLPLSIVGRIETIRMNILPRLLFLFQSLPIKISTATFIMLNKFLSKFIWQNKRPRIKLKTLMCSKELGGLNFPNLKNYYYAAQLRSMVAWVRREEDSIWCKMEQGDCQDIFLDTILFINPDTLSQHKKKVTNEWVKSTLSIWLNIRKLLNIPNSICRLIQIHHNPEFPPSPGLKVWAQKGLKMLGQIMESGNLMSFQQLQEKYEPAKDFYKYLQLRHYLNKHGYLNSLQASPSNIEQFFSSVIKKTINNKYISHAYKILQEDKTENTQYIKEKWELEMNVIINDDEWEQTMLEGHKITNSPTLREFEWKTKIRFFRTPFITSKFGKSSNQCWRSCGGVGDHTHIFWDCPRLAGYWKDIQSEIKNCLGVQIPLEPRFTILGIFPTNLAPISSRIQLKMLLLIAKKMITVSWLQTQPPTIAQWKNKLKEVYHMEQITARLQMKMELFKKKWSSIHNYMF